MGIEIGLTGILAGLGAAASAGGAILGGVAANNAGKYQQQVAEMNARIAEDNARRSIEKSQSEQYDQDMQTRAELATQEAVQAGSGLSITGGSQMLTRKAAAQLGRRDALNVRQQGELESYNFKTQAVSQRAEGELARSKGRSAMLGSYFQAGGSLLSSAQTITNPKFNLIQRRQ